MDCGEHSKEPEFSVFCFPQTVCMNGTISTIVFEGRLAVWIKVTLSSAVV